MKSCLTSIFDLHYSVISQHVMIYISHSGMKGGRQYAFLQVILGLLFCRLLSQFTILARNNNARCSILELARSFFVVPFVSKATLVTSGQNVILPLTCQHLVFLRV